MKKYLSTLTLSSVLAIPAASHAEFKSGFADIGVHYPDWTGRTTEKSSTKSHEGDLGYLELKGGVNFSWGEIYGFLDGEDFYNDRHGEPGSEQRYTFENTNHVYLDGTGLNLYLYACGTHDSVSRVDFHDDMFLYGIGYNFTGSGWWFKPLLVKRYTDQTYYTGNNSYVAGWAAGYSFMLGGEKFALTNWSEYEFDRDVTHATGNGGREGLNGAVALWWSTISCITTGIQYRYADDELGEDFCQGATIYSTKFSFGLTTAGAPGSMDSPYIGYNGSPSHPAISALPGSHTTSHNTYAAMESEGFSLHTSIGWHSATGVMRFTISGLPSSNGSVSAGGILMPMPTAIVGDNTAGGPISCAIFTGMPSRISATSTSGQLSDA